MSCQEKWSTLNQTERSETAYCVKGGKLHLRESSPVYDPFESRDAFWKGLCNGRAATSKEGLVSKDFPILFFFY